ncbi:MAG: hypothetical protein ACR2LF_09505 [Jatrophihabitantaceae bacterium]
MSLEHARAVADAVLYEGYLLYPYRASSSKNQSRWQFGVLGPPGALESGRGEDCALAGQCIVRRAGRDEPSVTVHLRFLQLQHRVAQEFGSGGEFGDVAELRVGDQRWLTWDEAVEQEITLGPWPLGQLTTPRIEELVVAAAEQEESITGADGTAAGRLVRSRNELHGLLRVAVDVLDESAGLLRLSVRAENVTAGAAGDKDAAIAASFIGAHLLLEVDGGQFVSMTDAPPEAGAAVAGCEQHRCWPVLAGPDGDDTLMLVSPIILYDHPELAPQSAGALFDSTEIDEILTLRVMTLTDEEKAAARATDPRAAEIIDRCDGLSPQAMQAMHGVLRDPHALAAAFPEMSDDLIGAPGLPDVDLSSSFGFDGEVPWWDPAVDESVAPATDEVMINGIAVANGSTVRVHPSRRSDAQDLFFVDQLARVTAVLSDVDGQTHVAVVLLDDPAADLHEWYGRYLYFAPDELEPIPGFEASSARPETREESRP